MSSQKGQSPEDVEETEVSTRARKLTGWRWISVYAIGISMSIFHLWVNTIGVMPGIHRNAVHLGFVLVLAFLLYPMTGKSPQDKFTTLDIILAVLGAVVAIYILLFEEELHLERYSIPIMRDYIFAALAIILLLMGTRRATGWFIPLLSLGFLLYALYLGKIIPGAFHYRGVAPGRLLYRMYFTDEGMFGIVCRVSSTFVFLFILFGAFLVKSGMGDFIIQLAQAITGRSRGGPAKIAVIASGFMGSVSGSAVANTVATGSFTIPLMKKTGYKPHVAAGVEAAASTGGQLMPPIMGAGAFIMAQWTGLSYLYIIAVAAIPAAMYFTSVGFFVHIRALKEGIKPLPPEEIPKLSSVLKKGIHFIVPLFLLIFLLVNGYTPTYAACWGILSIVVMSWVRKDTRMYPKDILDALYLGARNAIATASILICAGIIVGVAAITAVAITFSGVIVGLSHGILFIAIGLVAFASLILGMGLPVTASYIMLAVLAAPALKELGLSLIAAHMIIFWYSQDANVTPPICLAAYSASGVAGCKPMDAGYASWRLAKGLYIIPFLFAYTPLLFTGPAREAIITAVFATLGLFAFTTVFEGYFLRKTMLWERVLLGMATGGLLWPTFIPRIVGLLILISVAVSQTLIRQKPLLGVKPFLKR